MFKVFNMIFLIFFPWNKEFTCNIISDFSWFFGKIVIHFFFNIFFNTFWIIWIIFSFIYFWICKFFFWALSFRGRIKITNFSFTFIFQIPTGLTLPSILKLFHWVSWNDRNVCIGWSTFLYFSMAYGTIGGLGIAVTRVLYIKVANFDLLVTLKFKKSWFKNYKNFDHELS